MNDSRAYGAFLIWVSVIVLVSNPLAQEPNNPFRIGLVQDWTQHHIVFSRDALMKNPGLINSEPRILHQAMQRWQSARPQISASPSTAASLAEPQRDWNVSLGLGRVAPNMFPAKYSFNPAAAPDCTNDYVVFGLNHVGNAGQANLVAFNNLYSGAGPGDMWRCSHRIVCIQHQHNHGRQDSRFAGTLPRRQEDRFCRKRKYRWKHQVDFPCSDLGQRPRQRYFGDGPSRPRRRQ